MSDERLSLVTSGFRLRVIERDRELWFALEGEALPEAERLAAEGVLERRYDREHGDVLWRMTEEGARVVERHNAALALLN